MFFGDRELETSSLPPSLVPSSSPPSPSDFPFSSLPLYIEIESFVRATPHFPLPSPFTAIREGDLVFKIVPFFPVGLDPRDPRT